MTTTVDLQLNGVTLSLTGDFTKEEPMVRYYRDGSGHPGSPPEFEIHKTEIASKNESAVDSFIEEVVSYYENQIEVMKNTAIENLPIEHQAMIRSLFMFRENFWEHLSIKAAEKLQYEYRRIP